MNFDHVPVNWFDMVVVIVVMIGFNAGRKHGMSEELMATLQWVAIVVAGAFLYKPFGDMLAQSSPVSHLFCYITIYVTAAIVTKLSFSMVKKALGGKLIGSNVFGGGEYYLGMFAGGIRYCCMLIAALAILNAKHYSQQDIIAARNYQNQNFGSNFFPELSGVQHDVFSDSFVGSQLKKHASILLIASTKPETVGVARRKDDLP
jgi:uncharacterized membrane protein required for colicin V production